MTEINPVDPASFNHRFVDVPSGRRYHTVDQPPTSGATDAPVVLMCHGFPDLWYGWRYQIAAFVEQGWRCIVPSQLGYHDTDKPMDPAQYTYKNVVHDMDALLKALGIDGRVIVCGHDWGGLMAWRFASYFPDRVLAVASVSTPYFPPASASAKRPTVEEVLATTPSYGYQFYYALPEAAFELDEAADLYLASSLSPVYRRELRAAGPAAQADAAGWHHFGEKQKNVHEMIQRKRSGEGGDPAPGDEEFAYYLSIFTQHGFAAPLNWYKTRYLNFFDEQADLTHDFPAHIPALMVHTKRDQAFTTEMCFDSEVLGAFPGGNLEVEVVDVDHWGLQDEEKRGEVTGLLVGFVKRVLEGEWVATGEVVKP